MLFGRVTYICSRYRVRRLQQGRDNVEEVERRGHGPKTDRRAIEEEGEEEEDDEKETHLMV